MGLTPSFTALLRHFVAVFTAPTLQTFGLIITGWALSAPPLHHRGDLRRRQCRQQTAVASPSILQRCFLGYRRLVHVPGQTGDNNTRIRHHVPFGGGRDTLCCKRGSTLYGAGMHYDPIISSRGMSPVRWGHDWVVLGNLIVKPFWTPTKAFALPVAVLQYRNRLGLIKRKKGLSFADMLTTLRRVSYEETNTRLLPRLSGQKTKIAQLIELLGRAG
jgi:hypothetical protein